MRRELKLVLLVFCLVVGPAVVLSFLAGRVLGNWQVILQNRMEVAAAKALKFEEAAQLRDQIIRLQGKTPEAVAVAPKRHMNAKQAVRAK
ncbi:MAG: UvrB/UvrC motif-containing protein, partial [bacterium]